MPAFAEFDKFIRRNVPLAMHTWLQLGGPAEYFAEPKTLDELLAVLRRCRQEEIPARILGFGSNLLVPDAGVPGMVIRLTSPVFCDIRNKETLLTAGGGAKLGRIVTHSAHAGLAGLEGLIGIPGTVGGALYGNVGTNHGDIANWVESVVVTNLSGEVAQWTKEEIAFSQRHDTLADVVILSATFRLTEDDPLELAKRLQNLWIIRKTQQPMSHQGGGRLFRNPPGLNVSELIERAGLKGTRIGGAVICDRNTNFVLAEPECTSGDVLRLIDLVHEQVAERLEIELELELEIW